MNSQPKVAIVGASGLVGRTMAEVLSSRNFPLSEMRLFASERSAGRYINFKGKDIKIECYDESHFDDIDIVLMSAGGELSREEAPKLAKRGCVVIDNSSAWRMDAEVPLVVPEVNPEDIKKHRGIIANPNCSTIQLAVAVNPLIKAYGLRRLVCSTYQSISGAGQKGVDKLNDELSGAGSEGKHPIAFNAMFHPLSKSNGFTEEENKMYNELRKIMAAPEMRIAITCVRLPILGGHGEAVNLELDSDFALDDVRSLLSGSEGIMVMDDMEHEEYATPQRAAGTDGVYVSRLHRDYSVEYGLYLWVVADNLRKGAATNAVQIAEKLIGK